MLSLSLALTICAAHGVGTQHERQRNVLRLRHYLLQIVRDDGQVQHKGRIDFYVAGGNKAALLNALQGTARLSMATRKA